MEVNYQQLNIPTDYAGLRFDQVLAKLLPTYSRSQLQTWLKNGQILLDGQVQPAKYKVWGGEKVSLSICPQEVLDRDQAEDIALNIVYQDQDILVINKPAGLVVHPGNGNRHGTLLNALLHHFPHLTILPRAGIVHRLDKETSGLMVVALNLAAQTALIRQMQSRLIHRYYRAIILGRLENISGKVDAPIARHPVHRTRMAVVQGGRNALTYYRVLQNFKGASLLQCQLETGRTHQIRVHMAYLGHPLLGDPVYATHRAERKRLPDFPRQALHAFRLGLNQPTTGQDLQWQIEDPEDLQHLLKQLEQINEFD